MKNGFRGGGKRRKNANKEASTDKEENKNEVKTTLT